jgi:hypothetical protein
MAPAAVWYRGHPSAADLLLGAGPSNPQCQIVVCGHKAEAREMSRDVQTLCQVDFFVEELCTFDGGAIRIILVGAITNVVACTNC